MKIGFPGNTFEIPAPSSGMGFGSNSDTETFELDTGGRFVVDKPTTYKTFNMSWRSKTRLLQPLIDIYNKRYGTKPFYLQDMNGGEGNILPARWAYPEQLAAIHGACGGAKFNQDAFFTWTTFKNNKFATQAPTLIVPLILAKPMYLAVFRAEGWFGTDIPVKYRLYNKGGQTTAWTDCPYTIEGNAPVTVLTRDDSQFYEFIEIKINLDGNTHSIKHMDMSTSDYRSYETPLRSAEGVGGLKFTNVLDGELTMLKSQRIGLSVDITEVQQ